jgi:hypothetical protein
MIMMIYILVGLGLDRVVDSAKVRTLSIVLLVCQSSYIDIYIYICIVDIYISSIERERER